MAIFVLAVLFTLPILTMLPLSCAQLVLTVLKRTVQLVQLPRSLAMRALQLLQTPAMLPVQPPPAMLPVQLLQPPAMLPVQLLQPPAIPRFYAQSTILIQERVNQHVRPVLLDLTALPKQAWSNRALVPAVLTAQHMLHFQALLTLFHAPLEPTQVICILKLQANARLAPREGTA